MGINDYIQARKLGLKAYHASVQKHLSPSLPVLEEIVPNLNALSRVPLGLMQIPLKWVIGASTKARTNAFAPNFMPILEPNSEFCNKWYNLYDSVVERGMLSPIVVLEYLHQYYLVEGNKRVSVMKYLDAVFVEAEVTRVMPYRTDEKDNRIYFEYLDFYRDTSINYIWFSQEGSFERLYELTDHTPGVRWTSEERQDFSSAYMNFQEAYKGLYGDRLSITSGDAFLVYLSVFGYKTALGKLTAEWASEVSRLKNEFERAGGGETISLITQPHEQRTGGLLSALFRPENVKVAFLYHHSPRESGWNYWHELGRINAENALGERMISTVCVCDDPDLFEGEIERLIEEGNTLIFATSPLMLSASIKPSVDHSDVKILNCSLLASYYHVRSYYLRIYEAKFLIGMIAGALCGDGLIGYIADYPIYGAPASINAFALGARMVNPRARVELAWSTKADFDPADPFPGKSISLVSNRDINAPKYSSKEYGLYSVENGEVRNLAIALLDWSRFYESITRSVLEGTFDADADGSKAMDYWWGMSADALDIVTSTRFDPYLKRMVRAVQSDMQSGQFWVFEGLLRSQDGATRCEPDSRLTYADILTMDWLIDNVNGEIPETSQIRESARAMVEMQGIREIAKPDVSAFQWKDEGR